jgi:membrane fusion protein (multidrug efflux system)
VARIETEVEDLQETARPRVVETHAPAAKLAGDKQESPSEVPSRRISRWILLLAATIAVAGASLWWVHSQDHESTDDAQIEGHLDLVSSRISGTVVYINPQVENNQLVEAGTLLMELDPRDYAAELELQKRTLRPAQRRRIRRR